MIAHLSQYLQNCLYFLLCMVRYTCFGAKVISRLIGLIYENIAKMANKIFNVRNNLKQNTNNDCALPFYVSRQNNYFDAGVRLNIVNNN